MTRKEHKTFADPRSAAKISIRTVLEVWGTNSTLSERSATLHLTAFDLSKPEWRHEEKKEIKLAPNASTELWAGDVPGQDVRTKLSEVPRAIIVSARLIDSDGAVLSRYSNW
jgi:beta-mannosidase